MKEGDRTPVFHISGIRCLYLHLLCAGDGGEDAGSGDLRPSLLPWRYVEQAGLFHRHGRVSIHTHCVTHSLGVFAVNNCGLLFFSLVKVNVLLCQLD